jgi:hypothetical protein
MSDEEEDSLVIRSFAISPKRIFAFEKNLQPQYK